MLLTIKNTEDGIHLCAIVAQSKHVSIVPFIRAISLLSPCIPLFTSNTCCSTSADHTGGCCLVMCKVNHALAVLLDHGMAHLHAAVYNGIRQSNEEIVAHKKMLECHLVRYKIMAGPHDPNNCLKCECMHCSAIVVRNPREDYII